MPEVTPEKNLEMYRQCEIRRPSLSAILNINGRNITKPAGYYFDIVWIKNGLAQKDKKLRDSNNNEWIIAEVYGPKLMASFREKFEVVAEFGTTSKSEN